MIAVDTNLLVYAHRRESHAHGMAFEVLRALAEDDARVAVICIAHGIEVLLTRDRDFSLFPELKTRNPFESSVGSD